MKLKRLGRGCRAYLPAALFVAAFSGVAGSQEEAASPSFEAEMTYTINTLIMFISAVLVIFMQAGFAMLEVGLNAAKNTVNILFKNVMDLSIGIVLLDKLKIDDPVGAWPVHGLCGIWGGIATGILGTAIPEGFFRQPDGFARPSVFQRCDQLPSTLAP